MATRPGGSAIDGGKRNQERPATDEPSIPFGIMCTKLQRSLTRAFDPDENVKVRCITDARQPVVRTRMKQLGIRLIQTAIVEPDHETAVPLSYYFSDESSLFHEGDRRSCDLKPPSNFEETQPERGWDRTARNESVKNSNKPKEE